MSVVDVVLVGAGAAGLSAAKELERRGRSFVVLEGRNRIGGRAWTESFGGQAIDRGAQWLHSAHLNPLVAFARQVGVGLTPSSHRAGMMFDKGAPVVASIMADYERATKGLEVRAALGGLFASGRALSDVMASDFWGDAVGRLAAALEFGAEPDAVSLHDLIRTTRGEDLAVDGGLGALVATFGANVPVRLGAEVRTLRWSGAGPVTAEGSFGSVNARTALVTVSTGVLAGTGLVFDPPLPSWKQDAVAALPMGLLTKISFNLPGPAVLPEYTADLPHLRGRHFHLMHLDATRTLATVLLGGDGARNLMRRGSSHAVEFGRAILSALVGERLAAAAQGSVSEWDTDPFALGSYAVVRPGASEARKSYDRPIGDRLFFAGEASDTRQPGTVGGAVLAGASAAARIDRALNDGSAAARLARAGSVRQSAAE